MRPLVLKGSSVGPTGLPQRKAHEQPPRKPESRSQQTGRNRPQKQKGYHHVEHNFRSCQAETTAQAEPHGLKGTLVSIEARTSKGEKKTEYLYIRMTINSKNKGGAIDITAMAWGKAGDGIRGLTEGSKLDLFGHFKEGSFQVLRSGLQTTKEEREAAQAAA